MIIYVTLKDGRIYIGSKLKAEPNRLILTAYSGNRVIMINNEDVENVEVS